MILNSPTISGSLTVTGNIISSGSITLSGSVASASYAATASFVALAQTASFVANAQTASFVALAQSASNAVSSATASFANTFTVASTLTAQTLVVQTITSSVDFVTGSTRFGSILGNTHVFTGSVNITGSQTITGTSTTTGTANIGNDVSNPSLVFKTGGSTNYSGLISTNSNVDIFNIAGGTAAHYDSGSSIGFTGTDRYGTKTAGMLSLNAGNAVNNTTYGYISMNTGNTERVRINYGGQLLINTTSTGYNNPMLFVSASAGVCVPLQAVADASGRLIRFYNSDYNNSSTGTDIRMGFAAGSGNTSFNMQVYNAGETTSGSLVLQPSYGYVGIGTSSPTNTLQVNGNIKFGVYGLVRNTSITLTGNSTSGDVFRLLDSNGGLLGAGTICGTLYIVAFDTATGGNQVQYQYTWLSGGNGTGNATFTQTSSNLRGTNPLPSISMVNDGAGGGTKITGTSAGSGVSGANVWVTFIGTVQ